MTLRRFKLKPVGKKTQANRQGLRKARAARIRQMRTRERRRVSSNPFASSLI